MSLKLNFLICKIQMTNLLNDIILFSKIQTYKYQNEVIINIDSVLLDALKILEMSRNQYKVKWKECMVYD